MSTIWYSKGFIILTMLNVISHFLWSLCFDPIRWILQKIIYKKTVTSSTSNTSSVIIKISDVITNNNDVIHKHQWRHPQEELWLYHQTPVKSLTKASDAITSKPMTSSLPKTSDVIIKQQQRFEVEKGRRSSSFSCLVVCIETTSED